MFHSFNSVFDIFEDETVDCAMINLPEVLSVRYVEVHYERPAQLILRLREIACHLDFLTSYYALGDLHEVRLCFGRGQHAQNMLLINLLVEIYCENRLACANHLFDQLAPRHFLLLFVRHAAIHFCFKNIKCHFNISFIVASLDNLHTFLVCNL